MNAAVDYRLAPEHPYPAALQDASHAFFHLTSSNGCGFDPENVTAAGDSAGGGLMLALMMYQRDYGLPTPSKAILLSVSCCCCCLDAREKRLHNARGSYVNEGEAMGVVW